MPIYNASLTNIDIAETQRYAGLAKCTNFSHDLLFQACSFAQILAVPQGTWNIYPYDANNTTILLPQPLPLNASSIKAHLARAEQVAVMAVTIGIQIEQEITAAFTRGNYVSGLLLDAAATTAVEAVADQVNNIIIKQAAQAGYITLSRFSPGYSDWDITIQPHILKLAGGGAIGITVTPEAILIPRKSITAVIGLIPNRQSTLKQTICPASCPTCTQQNCLSRKE